MNNNNKTIVHVANTMVYKGILLKCILLSLSIKQSLFASIYYNYTSALLCLHAELQIMTARGMTLKIKSPLQIEQTEREGGDCNALKE